MAVTVTTGRHLKAVDSIGRVFDPCTPVPDDDCADGLPDVTCWCPEVTTPSGPDDCKSGEIDVPPTGTPCPPGYRL